MDREGDAYEVMMTVVDAGDSAIIRCAQNRRIDDPLNKAHEAVRTSRYCVARRFWYRARRASPSGMRRLKCGRCG